jgi:type I restriction enzyme S subunit
MDFTEEEEEKFALRPGDLLVCEGGEPGRAAVWSGQMRLCCYQKALHRLRPIGGCADPYFLMYRLWFGAVTDEFFDSQAKTTIAHLPAVRLGSLLIGLPSITEQQRIAVMLNERMSEANRVRKAAEEELAAINALPAVLLKRGFSGEL